ncbi:MAG: 4,5-DOPA dioxygenase extradiol [Cyclobacteriaceae bacterium]|nr:4,5-DOPA dioxygenase extradiol [Cyclobacteriaceae bacterium]
MTLIKDLQTNLPSQDEKTPLLFIGHGSPMNGIEDNEFSQQWEMLGKKMKTPAAVLCISAHWLTHGTQITAMEQPRTIHDFYGFPQPLFEVQYPAPGHPALAAEAAHLVHTTKVELDHEWGLDHGTWSVVKRMFPEANVPVLQLSLDYAYGPKYHYELAKELSALRKKGVLIIGSGNMVHNLRALNWQQPASSYDWAEEMNTTFKSLITTENHAALQQYTSLGAGASLAIPTPEHYLPLMYILGLKDEQESVAFFNDKIVMGSVSMTSVKIS